jgi:hypothetical protein
MHNLVWRFHISRLLQQQSIKLQNHDVITKRSRQMGGSFIYFRRCIREIMMPENKALISPANPRLMGWIGLSALAMGSSGQMVFLLGALIAGH